MASKNSVPSNAQWARWQWSKGLGRWHRLFADGDLTKTACGSPRKDGQHVAAVSAAQPSGGSLCPTCKWIVELNDKLHGTTDAIATDKITVGVKSPSATPIPSLVPVGISVPVGACLCGAAKCDQGGIRDIRLAVEAQKRADAEAGFAAFLASKAVAA